MSFYDLSYEQDKFIHYAKENTRSFFEHHDHIPSSPGQVALAKELVRELKDMGLDAYYNDKLPLLLVN
ncbi:Peptidase T [Lactobacillus helveticus]|nr:Peptidase T [Lactobacillus helveticus]